MKIGSLDTKPVVNTTPAERPATGGPQATGASSSAAEPSAQVQISSTASMLAGLEADPTFDSAKVERIAQAIREGKFEVNPEAIADKLIVNAAELLGRKPS